MKRYLTLIWRYFSGLGTIPGNASKGVPICASRKNDSTDREAFLPMGQGAGETVATEEAAERIP